MQGATKGRLGDVQNGKPQEGKEEALIVADYRPAEGVTEDEGEEKNDQRNMGGCFFSVSYSNPYVIIYASETKMHGGGQNYHSSARQRDLRQKAGLPYLLVALNIQIT